jgi:Phage protein
MAPPTALKNRLHNAILITTLTPRQTARIAYNKGLKLERVKKPIESKAETAKKPMQEPPSRRSTELLQDLSNTQLMEYTGAHFTTIYRWRRQKRLPVHIEKLLQFVALHQLDQLGWEGWRIENKMLVSPSGGSYAPGMVDAIQLRQQELSFYKAERRTILGLTDQPALAGTEESDDEFLAEHAEKLRLRFTKEPPPPIEIDDFESGSGTKRPAERDEYLLEEIERHKEQKKRRLAGVKS